MSKIIKAGLTAILAVLLSGCAYVIVPLLPERTETSEYKKSPVIVKQNKKIIKNIVYEKINNFKQEGYNLEVLIAETSKNIVQYDTKKAIDTVRKETRVKGSGYWGYTLELGENETIIDTKTFDETEEKEEEQAYLEPCPGIPVMFSSSYFRFNNNSNQIISETDKTGKASAKIISGPQFWRADQKELEAIIKKGFDKQVKYKPFIDQFLGAVQIKNAGYDVTVKTCKKDSVIVNADSSIPQKAENTEGNFTVKGFEPDFTRLYEEAKKLIKKDMEEKYVSTIRIKVRDTESHVPISNGTISLTTKKAVKLQDLINTEIIFREKYFVKDSGLFRETKIDPSYLIVDLDKKQIQISADGTEIKSTNGFIYDIECTHPEYKFLKGKLSFNEKNQNLIIDMLSLGSKIRKEDLGNTFTGIKKEK